MSDTASINKLNLHSNANLILPIIAVLFAFVVGGIVAYRNTKALSESSAVVAHTHEVLSSLDDVLSLLKDAETGQRGYIITGNDRYLEPYRVAINQIDQGLDRIETLVSDNPSQLQDLPALRSQIAVKLEELAETVEVRRENGFEAAEDLVAQDRGRDVMVSIREQVGKMQDTERELRRLRLDDLARAYQTAVGSGIITTLIGIILACIVGYLLRQAMIRRSIQEWLQSGQIQLNQAMSGEQSYEELGKNVLRFFAEYLDAKAGAMFVAAGHDLKLVSTYGTPPDTVPKQLSHNDGLVGQSARDKKTIYLNDVPDGYINFGSALGSAKPKYLVIVPVTAENISLAVMELAFEREPEQPVLQLFQRVTESIGPAVKSVEYRFGLQNLLEETQRQAEELQVQSEELRVANEEMEEQTRALQESQARLEQQQLDLEESNVQLEEQTQQMESQRDDIVRARLETEAKAREVEQASRYKSDFLANMSHELRTPLNSSLILAKLLADNSQGNLTDDQINSAKTILSSGNDLLALINDILDLSKIEAGRMDIRPEAVSLPQFVRDIENTMRPLAQQKGLAFSAEIEQGCTESVETDRQRLDQIVKNLLSNAVKFTEAGEVSLRIAPVDRNFLQFEVRDTGIGIEPEKQHVIFEAFRQIDSATNRKYSGTGLGLSISRELARLLGGRITVVSESRKGSTFTLVLPINYEFAEAEQNFFQTFIPVALPTREATKGQKAESTKKLSFEDDRGKLNGDARMILAVEDDESFARIVYDLVHELKFQCVVATSAEEAMALTAQFLPSAVVLDIGLPDHSGLAVLDRLKHDSRTRHIPVHVISANDYAEAALSLGAVGYMLKPVTREKLLETIKGLEARLVQRLRRVLVVEDDAVQLESVRKLLGTHDVETVGARTAAECLDLLKTATFDCMVLDLSLPDATGYSLLETLSREDSYSFPPVIVYTGRELSGDEEMQLRKYSKSIIIKGAKSPERLLDEVTLFLHQVVSELPLEQRQMIEWARNREATLEGKRILIVEDDVRNVFALTSILEPRGISIKIARNGREAVDALDASLSNDGEAIDLVLMDVMMPEMDGLTATREIRKRKEFAKLPIIVLTAKAMRDDHENCIAAGANDYMAKPLDVDKLLSLIRVWIRK